VRVSGACPLQYWMVEMFDSVTGEVEITLDMVKAGVAAMKESPHEDPMRLMVDILVAAINAAGFKAVAQGTVKPLWG
jgi:hypothetical protein